MHFAERTSRLEFRPKGRAFGSEDALTFAAMKLALGAARECALALFIGELKRFPDFTTVDGQRSCGLNLQMHR